jgi:hypothetical protein
MTNLTGVILSACIALLAGIGIANAQSQPVHGRWQWMGTGDYPPEVYCALYLDTDGMERADIGELYPPHLPNGTTMRPLLAMHGIVRRLQSRNFILLYLEGGGPDVAEFSLQPNGNLVLEWLPWPAGLNLRRLAHWPSDEELRIVVEAQSGAFRRRIEMTPADKPFPDLN